MKSQELVNYNIVSNSINVYFAISMVFPYHHDIALSLSIIQNTGNYHMN